MSNENGNETHRGMACSYSVTCISCNKQLQGGGKYTPLLFNQFIRDIVTAGFKQTLLGWKCGKCYKVQLTLLT